MKTLDAWLNQYGESHRNLTNRILHKICVPLIFFSVLGLLWDVLLGPVRLTYVLVALCLPFYVILGWRALAIILPQLAISILILNLFFTNTWAWPWCLAIFVAAWIGQFIGHKIEGKKPSFFEDLTFLFIGPLWIFLGTPQPTKPSQG